MLVQEEGTLQIATTGPGVVGGGGNNEAGGNVVWWQLYRQCGPGVDNDGEIWAVPFFDVEVGEDWSGC